MKPQQLWYVRRGGRLLGPHPRQVVVDGLLLGRFSWDDPGSLDGRAWQPLKMFPEMIEALQPAGRELVPDPDEAPPISWHHERLAAARRWADDRSGIDRRTGAEDEPVAPDRRAHDDRRQQRELLQMVLWRRLRRELAVAYERTGAPRGWWLPIALALGLAFAVLWWQRQPSTIEVSVGARAADCAAPAAATVNWAGCDKSRATLSLASLRNAKLAGARLAGADLRRADLGYADLSGSTLNGARLDEARLFGANLGGADLSDAALDGADLGFADLRNAKVERTRFDRARLGNAIWTDGRRCAATSVGRCQ
jgi:hypothetical protein